MCLLTHVESTVVRGSVTLIHLSSDLSEGGPFMTPTSQLITLLKVLGQNSPFLYAFKSLPPMLPLLEPVFWGLFLVLAVNHSVPSLPSGWTTVESCPKEDAQNTPVQHHHDRQTRTLL